ncbi:MAG: type II toxin-antitoxin system death-on-curing family toxin [Prosthecobacter sp.]
MKEPEWVARGTVLQLHRHSINEHGGTHGIRDEGLLDSALGKPENVFAYSSPAIFDLAASYTFGLVKNHPFLDGNKRTAFVTGVLFLELNGYQCHASEMDAAARTLALAAGEMTEASYAAWLESCSVPVG